EHENAFPQVGSHVSQQRLELEFACHSHMPFKELRPHLYARVLAITTICPADWPSGESARHPRTLRRVPNAKASTFPVCEKTEFREWIQRRIGRADRTEKIFVAEKRKSCLCGVVPRSPGGALRDRHERGGRDAMDAMGQRTVSCG